MYNLVQAQEALQGMPTADVMKYANQQNPQVPAYLALSELNRRKQLEQTQSAFSGQPQTVKQQIEGAFTQAPPGQMNPAQAPRMVNPAGARTNAVNPTAPPPQLAPETPLPVNPTQAPPAPQMAEGGLAALPIHRMFSSDSYASGGIVAFGNPDLNPNEDQLVPSAAEIEAAKRPFVGVRPPPRTAGEPPKQYPESKFWSNLGDKIGNFLLPQDYAVDKPRQKFDPSVYDREDMEMGLNSLPSARSEKQPSAPRVNKPSSPPAAPAASAEPPKQLFNTAIPKSDDLTDEELYARNKKLQRLAGVSEDPYADIKKRYSDIEARRAKDSEGDALRGLAASLSGFATAAPEKGFGYAAAMGAEAGTKFDRDTAALRDKQAMEMAELNKNLAKEDDARRRGDVAGVEAARAAQVKNRLDIAKLETERVSAGAHVTSAEAAKKGAEAQWYHATHPQASQTQQLIDLYTKAPEVFNALHPKENPLVTAAAKSYFDNEMVLKKDYPTVQDYLAAKGLSSRASPSASSSVTTGTLKQGIDGTYRFKGGNPNDKANWEKV